LVNRLCPTTLTGGPDVPPFGPFRTVKFLAVKFYVIRIINGTLFLSLVNSSYLSQIRAMAQTEKFTVNVLAYQEGEAWIAQCVEYDIYARAENLPKLPEAFGRALAANVCINAELGREGLSGIAAAPQRIKEAFLTAKLKITDGIETYHPIRNVIIGEMKIADQV
jgi:hypothetical protein